MGAWAGERGAGPGALDDFRDRSVIWGVYLPNPGDGGWGWRLCAAPEARPPPGRGADGETNRCRRKRKAEGCLTAGSTRAPLRLALRASALCPASTGPTTQDKAATRLVVRFGLQRPKKETVA